MNDWLEQNKKQKQKTKTGSLTSRQEELSFKSPARSIFSLIKISPKYSPLSPPSLFLPHPFSQAAAAQASLTVARQAKEFSVDPGSVRYLLPCALSSPLVHLETPTNMFLLPGPLYLGSSFVQFQGLNIDRQTDRRTDGGLRSRLYPARGNGRAQPVRGEFTRCVHIRHRIILHPSLLSSACHFIPRHLHLSTRGLKG